MTDLIECGGCGKELVAPLPDACPSCFDDPRSVRVDRAGSRQASADPRGERARSSAPSSSGHSSPGATVPCSSPGCDGTVAAGRALCLICEMLNRPTELTYALRGRWGEFDVPPGSTVTLGRDFDAAPVTATRLAAADRVSRIHAHVTNDGGRLTIVDASTNGTTVNGDRLVRGECRDLLDGDLILLGTQVEFTVVGNG